MLHRVVDELDIAREPELLEDAPAIGADRRRTEVHLLGDLLEAPARGEEPHHAVLAIRKPLVRRAVLVGREPRGELLRERGAHVAPAAHDLLHRGRELLARALPRDVAPRARLDLP